MFYFFNIVINFFKYFFVAFLMPLLFIMILFGIITVDEQLSNSLIFKEVDNDYYVCIDDKFYKVDTTYSYDFITKTYATKETDNEI